MKYPDDWQLVRLDDCAEILMGQSPKGDTYNTKKEGIPLLNGPVEFGRRVPTPVQWTTSPTRIASSGDILFCVRGNTTGRMNVADQPYCIGRGLAAIRGKLAKAETAFVSFLLEFIKPRIYSIAIGGGSTFPNISRGSLLEFDVPRPPLAEQRKIAALLGLVEQAIRRQGQLAALTTELKKALLHKLFTQGLHGEPQKQTEIGPMPESWEPTTLGTCCDIVSGSLSYTDFLEMASDDDGDAVECMAVKVSDMNLPGNENEFVGANAVRRISAATAHRKLVPPNTVVFPKRGAAIATNKKRLTTTWTVLDPNLIGVHAKSSLSADFLFHWVQTFDLRNITDPGPTPQLNKKDLMPILMPLPKEMDEQQEIAKVISTVDHKLTLHQGKHAAHTALFRTLLQQLMTAQLRVHKLNLPELEDSEASAL